MADSAALERMVSASNSRFLFLAAELRGLTAPFDSGLDCLVDGGRIAFDFAAPGWRGYGDWRDDAPAENPNIEIGVDDGFNIIYSSGTTGVPKGILHSHGVRVHTAKALAEMDFAADSVVILSTPLYSNTTLVPLLPAMMVGAAVVLMRKFDVEGYLALVEKYRCSHTMLVPVQYHRIMAHPRFADFDLSSMKVKLSTSAPLRETLKRDIVARFPGLMIEIYGLTEGGGGCVLNCNENPDKLASVGQAGLGTEVRIIDPEGNEVAQGETGEIVGRSALMMNGYFGREDLTSEILWRDAEGKTFFRSGDAGYFDEDGFLFLSDRLKDMIISGGFNIYATDLEIVLAKHGDIDDVAVIAIPSEQWGETPLGLVVRKPGAAATAEEIRLWANESLGKAQRLSAIEFRDELPRSSIGKILKRELRAPYWENR